MQCKGWANRRDGFNPPKNAASTGTMIRIVKEVSKWYKPQWNRQGQVKNFLQALILLITFVSLTLFPLQMITFRFTIVFIYPNVKFSLKNVRDICIKFLLLTLRICKLHFV